MARKSEGLGTKIWPDRRVWAKNKWPEFFWDGFGIGVWAAGPTRPEKSEVWVPKYVTFVFVYFNYL